MAAAVVALVIVSGAVWFLASRKSNHRTPVAELSRLTQSTSTTTSTYARSDAVAASSTPTSTAATPVTTTTVTTTTSAASSPTQPASQPAQPVATDGAVAALRQYWSDLQGQNYAAAYALEGPHEQAAMSTTTMSTDDASYRIISVTPAVMSGPGEAHAQIEFYSRNQSGADQNCRKFVLDELMAKSGTGWLYNGLVPGAAIVDSVANGSANCPS